MAKKYSYLYSTYTDSIEAVGTVRRVYVRALVVFWDDVTSVETREWHYFGSTLAQYPLTVYPDFLRGYPVFEHPYISFPQDFDQLGTEANDVYFNLGIQAGLHREGIK